MALKLKTMLPLVCRKNFGTCSVMMAKASDPIQQLFLDKIAEFSAKSKDKNFLKQNPDLETKIQEELSRVTRQYGGNSPADLEKFPTIKLEEAKADPQLGF